MIERICRKCGKKFSIFPCRIKYGRGKYCSRKCYSYFLPKIPKGSNLWEFIVGAHPKGNLHYNWKGGRRKCGEYIKVLSRTHPFADGLGYILEHRLVMEKHLGRYLTRKEIVHHRNGNFSDNRIENLRLFKNKKEHSMLHHPKGHKVHLYCE